MGTAGADAMRWCLDFARHEREENLTGRVSVSWATVVKRAAWTNGDPDRDDVALASPCACVAAPFAHRVTATPTDECRRKPGATGEIDRMYTPSRISAGYGQGEWCPETDSNRRHCDFQSHALPTELSGQSGEPERGRLLALRVGPVQPGFGIFVGRCRRTGNAIAFAQPVEQVAVATTAAAKGGVRGIGGRGA